MFTVSAIKKWGQLSTSEKRMLCECLILMAWTRIKLRVLPFKRQTLGSLMTETPHADEYHYREILISIKSTFRRIKKHFPWHPTCLVKAMVAKKMLNRRGIPCTIYLGVAKDTDSGLNAHAWARCGTTYVTGAERVDLNAYTVVSCFGFPAP